ncbi:MAG TPA: PIN domain-containing protein [Rhizomicrobium sp.]
MPADFLDTNVLVYAFTTDPRMDRANALLSSDCITSVQGLNEFANVARRKLGMNWIELKLALTSLRAVLRAIVPLDLKTHDTALEIAERYGFSFYDSLMIAAALAAGSAIVWSEDMQHDMVIDGRLRIANPFTTP